MAGIEMLQVCCRAKLHGPCLSLMYFKFCSNFTSCLSYFWFAFKHLWHMPSMHHINITDWIISCSFCDIFEFISRKKGPGMLQNMFSSSLSPFLSQVWYVCNAGLACGGAHNRAELRAEAAVLHEKQAETYRFALCENWYRRGTCSWDFGCEFAHGVDEVRWRKQSALLWCCTAAPWFVEFAHSVDAVR